MVKITPLLFLVFMKFTVVLNYAPGPAVLNLVTEFLIEIYFCVCKIMNWAFWNVISRKSVAQLIAGMQHTIVHVVQEVVNIVNMFTLCYGVVKSYYAMLNIWKLFNAIWTIEHRFVTQTNFTATLISQTFFLV